MAYDHFKPEIWSTKILMARDLACIGVQNSWKAYEGEIAKQGDTVHIQGLVGATIKTYVNGTAIDAAENITDSTMDLIVDQMKYINFKVGDVDKIQSNVAVMNPIIQKTANDLAVVQDVFVYDLLAKSGSNRTTLTTATAANILASLGTALTKLRTNRVTGTINIELHPYIYNLIQQAVINVTLPNESIMKNGFRGMLLGANVYETPSVTITSDVAATLPVAAGTASAYYNCIIRTPEALAFAEQKAFKTEAYRPDLDFADAIKGFNIYGAKVVKPTELVQWAVQI